MVIRNIKHLIQRDKSRGKRLRIDVRGMQIRLFFMMLALTFAIILGIGLVQIYSVKQSFRNDTKNQLEDIARNISSTYGTTAYESSIRAAIYTGDYMVRTMMEDGTIMIDAGSLSYYISWPTVTIDTQEISQRLDQTNGYYSFETQDEDNVTWIIYVQVIASWDGQREILLVAKNTVYETERVRLLIVRMIEAFLVILVASFFVCWFVSRSFLKPIESITEKATALMRNDFSVQFSEDSYTEIQTLSQTLNQAVDSMANYEQLRRDMIANVSHDMRTPLTMIKAYAEMIQTISGEDAEKRKQHLDVIISQTDKLSDFVTKSLDLSIMQEGAKVMHMEWFALDELVRTLVTQIEELDEGKHQFRITAQERCLIKADRGGVDQIITNLVDNSLKYGGDVIHIGVFRKKQTVRLEVRDYGEGIPKDQLGLIWDKYYRIKPYDKDAASAGVGLSIVREVAQLHNIPFGVESEEGKGVCFWFEFRGVSADVQ